MKKDIFHWLKEEIFSIENSKLHIIYFIMFFFAMIALRGFWESYSDTPVGNFQDYTGPMIPHYFFWYITLAMLIIVILHLATREDILKLSKIVLPAFIFLLIVPFVDIIVTFGKGANITYMLPNIHQDIIIRWFTLSGSTPGGMGGSIGLKMEGIIVLIFTFLYVYIKKQKILWAILFSFIIYSATFWWGSLPYIIFYLQLLFGVEHIYSEALFTNFELFIILILGSYLLIKFQKQNIKLFVKKFNILNMIIYELIFLIGIAIAWNQTQYDFSITQISIFYWIFCIVLIPISYIATTILHHILSVEENLGKDVLPTSIPISLYKNIIVFLFLAIVVYSIFISFTVTFLFMIFFFSYFLYYNTIWKFYKLPIINKALIAQNVIVLTFIGYYLVVGRFNYFPYQILLFYLFALPLILTFTDIKTFDYDLQNNIITIPTFLGFDRGKQLIGACFPIIFAIPGLIYNEIILSVIMIIFGIITLIIITRKEYKETYAQLSLIGMLLCLIMYLFLIPSIIPY